jgi:peptidoglycan/LPS O-acetylase OafA/YrhL
MGLIRLILAITVVIGHSSSIFGLNFIGAQLAVEVFFIISGFYMALILGEKYNSKSTFITNRLLKIFPTYWVVLILCAIYELFNLFFHYQTNQISEFFKPDNHLNLSLILLFIFNNLFIFGQDLILFFGLNINKSTLFFTPNFREHQPPLYDFMLIPQAWSLALELTFYLIAPFINKLKTKWLLLIMTISFSLRIYIYSLGYRNDPWTYRFFPNEIFFFVSGILAYRLYRYIKKINISCALCNFLFVLYIIYLSTYQFIPNENLKEFFLFFATILSLPFIFHKTKNQKYDRFIGELSYPVYISHFLIINTITHFTNLNHDYLGLVATIVSIILAVLLTHMVINPIDRIRQKRLAVSNV